MYEDKGTNDGHWAATYTGVTSDTSLEMWSDVDYTKVYAVYGIKL